MLLAQRSPSGSYGENLQRNGQMSGAKLARGLPAAPRHRPGGRDNPKRFCTCPWPVSTPQFWPPEVRTPRGDFRLYVSFGPPPFWRASLRRKDSPEVATRTLWWRSRSSRLTAVVCSGRKRPQSSKGQCEPMPRERRS
jgi:hypothetical protein